MQFDDPELAKRKLRALVVDDNEHMRALLRRLLQRMGIENTEYADGSAALEVVETEMPDLILTDLTMQFMDGISFTRTIRRSPNEKVQITPVIMITGHADRHRVVEARDVGVNEMMVKPVTERGLLTRVQEVILRPRPFIFGPNYFGPCRRRRVDRNYRGPERRHTVMAI
jgi:two-component system chemotaxis response regulator CheY